MTKKVFINGAGGRIGRAVTFELVKAAKNYSDIELAGLNEPRGIDFVVENYQGRDSVHGIYDWKIEKKNGNTILINGSDVKFYAEKELGKIPFQNDGIEMVLECSGFFGDPKVKDKKIELTPASNMAREFLKYGVERVVQTYPVKTADATLIMGVNHKLYDPSKHSIISNASCTTKALAMPLQALLNEGIEIDSLSMDTTHAATASQQVLESLGQILTHSTGAAKATGEVIPSLKGRMSGMAYRVPTLDGSFANLYFVASSKEELNADRINQILRASVNNPRYAGRIGIFDGEDAGTFDIIGRRENAVIIPSKTSVLPLSFAPKDKKSYLVTLISGYDNELGSSVDPVLMANYIAGNS